MLCATVKQGQDCFFMDKGGCRFNGGHCYQIVEQCEGCQRVQAFSAGKYCVSFPDPSIKWRSGVCSMATHVKASNGTQANGKINPLKASKRRSH